MFWNNITYPPWLGSRLARPGAGRGTGLGLALGAALAAAAPAAAAPEVVVTIKPLHALVAGVMEGVAAPHLLVRGSASPHAGGLRPSDARRLERADLIIWVGPELESQLQGMLDALGTGARIVTLLDRDELRTWPARRGGDWDLHDADGGNKDGEVAPADSRDPHVWLDPDNARAMVHIAAQTLALMDPANAARYRANAERLDGRLAAMGRDIEASIAPVRDVAYIVFHDAYQYFERRFGLAAVGAVTIGPERKPGARRLRELRRRIASSGARCVFSEPQFAPRLVETLVEGTSARAAALDPLGAKIAAGPDAYVRLMRALARDLRACLAGPA